MESKKETREKLSVNEEENISKHTSKKVSKENDTREVQDGRAITSEFMASYSR